MSQLPLSPATPELASQASALIHATDPALWDYMFKDDAGAYQQFVQGLWLQPGNSFSHSEAMVIRDGDQMCGLELGFAGSAAKKLSEAIGSHISDLLKPEQIGGFITQAADVGLLTPVKPEDAYYLQFLSVSSLYQGKGVGRVLINNCFERAKKLGCASVHLDVYVDNPAVGLYQSFGFRIASQTSLPGNDEVPVHYRMIKPL